MELRHLRYFIAAAEEEHFGRASERLFVTRPAVSQMVADLEKELGTQLFERLAHKVRLTAAGRTLLPALQSVMGDLNQALITARRVGEGKLGALNVGYGSMSLLHPLFRAAIKQFRETFPDVTLSLFEIVTAEQSRAIADGRIHVGFMHFGPTGPGTRRKRAVQADDAMSSIEYHRIQTGSIGVVVPIDHPLARRRSVALAELASERFIVVPKSSVTPAYGLMYALCQKAGFEPHVVQEVSTISTQLNLVQVGMGIGFAVTSKHFTYPPSLAVIPIKDIHFPTQFILGWSKGQTEPVVEQMIEIVKTLAKAD